MLKSQSEAKVFKVKLIKECLKKWMVTRLVSCFSRRTQTRSSEV